MEFNKLVFGISYPDPTDYTTYFPRIEIGDETDPRPCKVCEEVTGHAIVIIVPENAQNETKPGRFIRLCTHCGTFKIEAEKK